MKKARKQTRLNKNDRGFLLVGIFIALLVLAVIAGAVAPSIQASLDAADLRTEREVMTGLKTDLENSFSETDLTRNVGALSGTGLSTSSSAATVVEDRTLPGNGILATKTVTSMSWQMKIAATRGHTLIAGASVTKDSDPTGIYFNRLGWSRILIAGPTNETTQRFLLISMMTPSHRQLTFPTGASVFDELWSNSWEAAGSTAPSGWGSSLGATAYQLWNERSTSNRTNASRLIVQRITQSKYTLTVVDNHPTDGAWVDIGPITNAIVAAPNGGTYSSNAVAELTTGIPSGRQIVVRRGTTSATATEVQRFLMTAPITITVQ